MSNSSRTEFHLTVDDDPTFSLSVISNDDRICATNQDAPIDISLPRGVYTIRAELNGQFVDTLVRHTEDQHVEPELPERFSAVPLPDAFTTHEYYTYSAWEISQAPTAGQICWDGNPSSGCLLFIRAPDRERTLGINQAETLILRTLDGKILSDFSDAAIDPDAGFTAWSADMSPGVVVLEDHGRRPRQLPIRLFDGFQTQVYVMYRGRPLFEDLRVLTTSYDDIMSRGGRDPYDRSDEFARASEQVDAGLAALANDARDIGGKLVREFLNSKFRNPLLGLIGAYLMLLRRHRGMGQSDDADLPSIVIGNLEDLMPGSADIAALKVLAEPWLGPPILEPVHDVPLLRIGAEILIQRAAIDPALIPEGSVLDAVSDRLLGDTVWTSWEPIELPVSVGLAIAKEQTQQMSWVELAIADAIDAAEKNLDTSKLAERIGVTNRAVRDAYEKLVVRTDEHPEEIELVGYDVNRMRRGLLSRVSDSLAETMRPVINRLAKEAPLTYQAVYPKLKTAIAEVKNDDESVRASDQIKDLVGNWSDGSLRSRIFDRIEENFLVKLDDIADELAKVETVRDIASLIVKKEG